MASCQIIIEHGLSWPVDIYELALSVKMNIKRDGLKSDDRAWGLLLTRRDSFLTLLRAGISFVQEEFTIAHEIGHTLFYKGQRHQIGILDKKELAAEEEFCDRFAELLLNKDRSCS